ncbi:MAG: radical SAM protein [Candidatus Omnitrophica bacterium]|nr:radical SAM protein [Candidatus Omnitrophota bacterium]
MKILFINPNSDFLINEKVFPSLGLLYLIAYLKQNGYNDISYIDMNDEKPLPESIDADIVGFYSNTPQFPTVMRLVKQVKKINRARSPLYVLGGPHVSGKPEDAFSEFDVVVKGEGERAILDIVRREEASTEQSQVTQCDYADINSFPFPDRDTIDIKSYRYYLDGKLTTTLVTSRGCPFGCKFCANNAWGKTLRMRSPQNVFEEVSLLVKRYGYEAVMFFDDTMTVDRKRMKEICDRLKQLSVIYRCFIRSDTVDGDILRRMRESGCVEVGVGIESGSQRILDTINKGETVKKNLEAIKLCHRYGIRVKGFFIIGLPGENRESIKETTDFLEEAGLDDIDITVYTPYPGSLIYKNKENFDINFTDDYDHAWFKGRPGDYTTKISTKAFSSDDIIKLRNSIEKRFKNPQPAKAQVK